MQGRDALTIFQQIAVDFSLEWGTLAVSLDLDSVAGVEAPGVSAPAVFGFSATQVSGFLQAAADNRCLRYLDLMELNPRFDIDHRTARLAAVLIWQVSQTITGQRGLV